MKTNITTPDIAPAHGYPVVPDAGTRVSPSIIVQAIPIIKVEAEKQLNTKSYADVTNLTIGEVRTLGKELFIFFNGSDACLRVHFLMNGSIHYNERINLKKDVAVVMCLTADVVMIYDSCVDVRSKSVCMDRYNSLHTVDICSPSFNYAQATDLIGQRSAKMVCDVIMDQDVLPGVGNIIKNEALFNSGIKPTVCIDQLTSQQVSCLLHRLRDFSAIFYKCRKDKSVLSRYYKVYGKQACVECKGRITVCKPGELKRVTFYCPSCQGNNTRLPGAASGSLLAFLQPPNCDDTSSMWHCSACTFLNKSTASTCKVCSTSKCRSTLDTNLTNAENRQENANRGILTCSIVRQTAVEISEQTHGKYESGKRKGFSDEDGGVLKVQRTQEDGSEPQVLPTVCHQHKLACVRKQVSKPGENHGRPFYVCRLPRGKQCNYFKWGDDDYPRCHHNKVTVLRSVLKLNSNNGKQFYCCPLAKNTQCNFFQWLEQQSKPVNG